MMIDVSHDHFLTRNRRARKPCLRAKLREWKRYRDERTPHLHIAPTETREELFLRARRRLEYLRGRKTGPHALSAREIRATLAEAAQLRAVAMTREKIDPTDKAFYVSIRAGARHGLLYGPLPTQTAALRAKPLVIRAAHQVNPGDAAFSSFGTCSIARQHAAPGLLNHILPAIPA